MRLAAAAALALAIAAPQAPAWAQEAPAQDQSAKPAGDGVSDGQQLGEGTAPVAAPGRAYIYFRSARQMGLLFRYEQTAEEAAAERALAMEDTQSDYRTDLAEWERIEASCRGDGAAAFRCRRARPRPVEPTLEGALALLPPDRNMQSVYRTPVFREENGLYAYLLPVQPGTYILYGQRDGISDGWAGVCLCMGSVRFDAPAGQIVDLGTITYPALDQAGARPATDSAKTDTFEPSIAIVPPQPGGTPPGGLAGLTIVPARLRAAGKMDNLLGLHIDRHPALEGVLRYERDRVIDARTGQPVDAPGD